VVQPWEVLKGAKFSKGVDNYEGGTSRGAKAFPPPMADGRHLRGRQGPPLPDLHFAVLGYFRGYYQGYSKDVAGRLPT